MLMKNFKNKQINKWFGPHQCPKLKKLGESDIEWSNPYEKQTTHLIGCIENFNTKNYYYNHEK
jgi:hypothetical protein